MEGGGAGIILEGTLLELEGFLLTVIARLGNWCRIHEKVISCKQYHCPFADSSFGKGFHL